MRPRGLRSPLRLEAVRSLVHQGLFRSAGLSFASSMWFRNDLALYVLHLQYVVQHHFDALHKGNAFHARVEDADVLGVEQSHGPGGVALAAGVGLYLPKIQNG